MFCLMSCGACRSTIFRNGWRKERVWLPAAGQDLDCWTWGHISYFDVQFHLERHVIRAKTF